jgi:hypothetical protein
VAFHESSQFLYRVGWSFSHSAKRSDGKLISPGIRTLHARHDYQVNDDQQRQIDNKAISCISFNPPQWQEYSRKV